MGFAAFIPLIIIGFVITLVTSSAERKKQQAAQKMKREYETRNTDPNVPPVRPQPQPVRPARPTTDTVHMPEAVRKAVQPGSVQKPQPRVAPRTFSAEGVGTEGPGKIIPRIKSDPHPQQKHPEHDLCALSPEDTKPQEAAQAHAPALETSGVVLSFTPNNIVRGVLFSEIFGKPKGLR